MILPIWHRVERNDYLAFSPTLADKYAHHADKGIPAVRDAIVDALTRSESERSK